MPMADWETRVEGNSLVHRLCLASQPLRLFALWHELTLGRGAPALLYQVTVLCV